MKYLLLVALLLTACAAPPVVPPVKVPVYGSCVKVPLARPAFATKSLLPDASDGEILLALARDHLVHFKYEGELEAVIAGCL
ncbi:hypothetical protein PO883_05065 [Massilia sp. DJPM01]|uniref:hypothetical protein n=1 Tax=Massilia sp. DJPM01 TaxID=3024404 RepID=UPI00259F93D8|nr:hypothetical protein [Massilia sp. DJPM01]MDM5176565.1 hypothetical protein [Massilia sp. DJPM01]